ncbi:hypothetical protein BDQ17DRAFT_1369018 [Cyathus striatus]|nr:hypothetical protein BDQ17DRAFT_1369018 [Cyathus striatus]
MSEVSLPVTRPGSIRSVASSSSIASGVSLTRRPRTRARSRTVTSPSQRNVDSPTSPVSELPYLDRPLIQEPHPDASSSSQEPLTISPARPPRSPQRLEIEIRSTDAHSSHGSELATAADATLVATIPHDSPSSGAKVSKATRQASNLSVIDTSYKPPPAAFRNPALTPVINARDSVSTQQSGMSSSLYPASTSSASGPESPPSPRSMAEQQESLPQFSAEVNEHQEYGSDDVSYRLRLLVKNSYFLPPAHSKPSPSDLASPNPRVPQKKTSSPTFLDFFRVGKAKSKPTTPTGNAPGLDPNLPMLRTTSESITTSYALGQQPRISTKILRHPSHPQLNPSRGRVVVVREKMNDISVAVKQAEQELKTRGVRLDQTSQKAKRDIVDDVIDPTDAVDLPLPSSAYPFAVQASALNGLGVQDSVGAALLADRLPPKSSTVSSPWDTEEDSWRRALLREAVHHSLDNSPNVSSFSQVIGTSTPPPPRLSGTANSSLKAAPPIKNPALERRIMEPPMMEALEAAGNVARKKSSRSQKSVRTRAATMLSTPESRKTHDSSRPNSFLPLRVDTPTDPLTPLTPPPRRNVVNISLFSRSQTSLPGIMPLADAARSSSRASAHTLRRAMSSPGLSDAYDGGSAHHLSPPPMPPLTIYSNSSSHTTTSFETSREHVTGGSIVSDVHSQYSIDAYMEPSEFRGSMALSAVDGRPSLSEYSQSSMSPTASAFQDPLNIGGYDSNTSSIYNPAFNEAQFRDSHAPRYSAMSPPPRVSSSLAYVSLLPPPRSGLRYSALQSRTSSSSRDRPTTPQEGNEETIHISAPEPTTPPLPIPERRGSSHHPPLSLQIPNTNIPVAIHSTPGPSSPTSFFDSIQTQPNAMDDLDSSSDESDDEDEDVTEEPSARRHPPFLDTRARAISQTSMSRPPFMRLGNHSTPYIPSSPVESTRSSIPVSIDATTRRPVGNIVKQVPFFTDRRSDEGHDFLRYTRDHPQSEGTAGPSSSLFDIGHNTNQRRPATADHVAKWQSDQRAQESLRRLDGMLIQHMEAEKDTIKRIATTLKQTASKSSSRR